MPEYTSVDNHVITLTQNTVTTVNTGGRGGSAVTLKADPTNTSPVYIGQATNRAAAALSATTGFPLAAGETLSLDLTIPATDRGNGGYLAAVSAGVDQKLCVLKLLP